MTDPRYSHTLRLLKTADNKWCWVILKVRNAGWSVQPTDVLASSDCTFDTAALAMAHAQNSTGGWTDTDPDDWDTWWIRKRQDSNDD